MGRLGVPYQGSKNAIAREIVACLPRGKRFVDLFAGGCAMTHAVMECCVQAKWNPDEVLRWCIAEKGERKEGGANA